METSCVNLKYRFVFAYSGRPCCVSLSCANIDFISTCRANKQQIKC